MVYRTETETASKVLLFVLI